MWNCQIDFIELLMNHEWISSSNIADKLQTILKPDSKQGTESFIMMNRCVPVPVLVILHPPPQWPQEWPGSRGWPLLPVEAPGAGDWLDDGDLRHRVPVPVQPRHHFTGLWLAESDHMCGILPLIGQVWLRDLDTGLWLVQPHHLTLVYPPSKLKLMGFVLN